MHRETLKKSVCLLIMTLMIVSLLVSCAESTGSSTSSSVTTKLSPTASSTTAATSAPKTFKVVVAAEPDSTDPTISKYQANNAVVFNNIFDVLVDLDWKTGKSIPGIAAWELKDGGKIVEFTVKKGIKFTSGDLLTAQDIEFSHNRLWKSSTQYQNYLTNLDKVEVIDDDTIQFVFKQLNVLFLVAGAPTLNVVSKSYYDRVGEADFIKNPAGTGPYKFVEWKLGEYVDLMANENYWGEKPQVKQVRVLFAAESTTRVAMLQAGEVDMILDTPWEQVPALEKAGLKAWSRPGPPTLSLRVHTLNANVPWYDKRVRQAMAYAIDRKSIVKNMYFDIPHVYAWLAPWEVGYDDTLTPYSYDPDKAKRLLAEAGYPDGFEMPLYYPTTTVVSGIREMAEYISLSLKAVNIRCNVTGLESVAFNEKLRNAHKDPAAEFISLSPAGISDTRDPSETLLTCFGTTGATSMYSNPQADALIQQIIGTSNDTQRGELIKQFYRIINEDMPIIPMLSNVAVYAMNTNVNYEPTKPFHVLVLQKVTVK